MSKKDKKNQQLSPKDMEAKKPISSKQAKELRKARKAAKAARK